MRVQQDSEREVINLLTRAIGADIVGAFLPEKWSPSKGLRVVVQSDGTPVSNRGWTRETLRVTVHGQNRSEVSKLARAIDGFLLSPSYGHFMSIKPGAGLMVTPDSKLGGHMASLTFRVAKPRIILGGENNGR